AAAGVGHGPPERPGRRPGGRSRAGHRHHGDAARPRPRGFPAAARPGGRRRRPPGPPGQDGQHGPARRPRPPGRAGQPRGRGRAVVLRVGGAAERGQARRRRRRRRALRRRRSAAGRSRRRRPGLRSRTGIAGERADQHGRPDGGRRRHLRDPFGPWVRDPGHGQCPTGVTHRRHAGSFAGVTRPVLMTVDDDPGVSRSVARDLRRRYGQDYRIVRAESGREALEALRELTLRGEPVAAILADYRMPEMNGVDFLEAAMDIAPHARRALLTAYADTDAAIRAINVVDVDHYLLKPWDPPEEKLYPVVDALVETWRAVGQRPVDEIRVVGHRWSAECFCARDFLARNSVPYRWYNIDEPEGERLLEAAGATPDDVPLIVTPDGTALRNPTEAEIAA